MGATNSKIQLRRDTAANWSTYNPTLSAGEPGFETDTGKLKIGDGRNSWSSLDYISGNQQASPIIDLGSGWMYPQDDQSLSELMDDILSRADNGSIYTGVFDTECEPFVLMIDRDCWQARIIGSALNKTFWWEFDQGGRVVCNGIRDPEIAFLDLNVEYDILDKDENSQAGLLYIVDQAVKSYANYIKGFTSDGVPFITLIDYANTEGTYISSLAVIKFSFHPSYEDDRGNYQGGTINIFSCITLLNAYFNCDVEVAEQKTLGVDTLTIRGNDVVSLINEIIDEKDFLPNTASAVANIISNNTSVFVEPFNYVISGNPSYFVGAVGAIISSAPSYFTSPIAEVMSAQPSVFSPAVAATISTNTSYFVNPIAQTMEYYPSNFNTALLNMMNAACGTSASHVSHLMISEAAVDAKISNVAAVAEGKTNSYVVEKTQGNSKLDSQNDSVVLSSGDFPLTTTGGSKIAYADLKIGDIIYITNTNVPDRWVGLKQNNSATLYKMETTKVDLANYYTKSEVDALIESKISQYLTSIEADDVEFGS